MVLTGEAWQHRIVPTILIVDDHLRFRTTARSWLTRAGFEVIGEAADGADALEAAARLRPDVVLLDVQLPDTNGFEIAARLTRNAASASAVVLTSTRDAAEFGDLIVQCGAVGFVPKAELSGPRLSVLLD